MCEKDQTRSGAGGGLKRFVELSRCAAGVWRLALMADAAGLSHAGWAMKKPVSSARASGLLSVILKRSYLFGYV